MADRIDPASVTWDAPEGDIQWDDERGPVDEVKRQLGLTARAGISGLTALPAALANVPAGLYNMGADALQGQGRGYRFPDQGQLIDRTMTSVGLPEPMNRSERVAQIVASMLTPGSAVPTKGVENLVSKASGLPMAPKGFRAPPATVKEQTIQAADDAGLVIPPTQKGGGFFPRLMETLGGKIATAQRASERNAPRLQDLVVQDLGLPKNAQVTPRVLEGLRKEAGGAYEAIKTLPGTIKADDEYLTALSKIEQPFAAAAREFPGSGSSEAKKVVETALVDQASPRAMMEMVSKLRADASDAFRAGDGQLGRAIRGTADAIEDLIGRHLERINRPELLRDFRSARQLIARTHDVEKALIEATGTVSARKLAQSKSPLTGGMKTAADFAEAFPKAAQDVERMGGAVSNSPLDWLASVGIGATVNPGMGAAWLGVRPLARSVALSQAPDTSNLPPIVLRAIETAFRGRQGAGPDEP